MPLYFCTPRGDVHLAPPIGQSLRYVEKVPDEEADTHGSYWMRHRLLNTDIYHVKPWGALPMRHARDIHEARVDFMFDMALKDTLADIRRLFFYADADRWSLARRQQRAEYRQKHGW